MKPQIAFYMRGFNYVETDTMHNYYNYLFMFHGRYLNEIHSPE
jgi:hypothetical protein